MTPITVVKGNPPRTIERRDLGLCRVTRFYDPNPPGSSGVVFYAISSENADDETRAVDEKAALAGRGYTQIPNEP